MPERPTIRVVRSISKCARHCCNSALPAQRDDSWRDDSLLTGVHDSSVYHGDRPKLQHLLLRAPP